MTMNKTILESLANELFIDLFEFFNAVDLLRTFHGLNTRFNSLLLIHFRAYRVDFRSICKEDFNIFYRTYFPSIINRIIYLRLSDDEDTPHQCAHFLSADFMLSRFDNLRSLTFNCCSSDPKIDQFFFSDFYRLRHLTHLKFVNCRFLHREKDDFQGVIDQIWSLPKLTHCYWDVSFTAGGYFPIPNVVSTSLQYLTIRQYTWYTNMSSKLLEKTPHLRKFSTSLDSYEEDDFPPLCELIPSPKHLLVKKLILSEVSSQRVMINVLQLLPNISHLKVEILFIKLDGYRWEQIIVNYLPQLKVLQFKMDISLDRSIDDQNNEEKVEQYLATYRTPFWIEHHQWFIRCHWGVQWKYLAIRVYSLPYKFENFPILDSELNFHTKSTCPREINFSYDSVRIVAYVPVLFNDEVLSGIQLLNIEILSLDLPIDHKFLSIISKLENLSSLNVVIPTRNYQSQLQALLDNAPHLYSLSFESWATSIMPPYQYTSASIRRLALADRAQSFPRQWYTTEQCIELSRSPLGIQCRVLIIAVEEPKSILLLINSMVNLRTLEILSEHDHRRNQYDLVQLLQSCLPSIWTVTRFCYGCIIIQS